MVRLCVLLHVVVLHAALVSYVAASSLVEVPGLSNPDGYVVLESFPYGACGGSAYEKRAVAYGACIPPGLRGETYADYHTIFTNNSDGGVDMTVYLETDCTRVYYTETMPYESCNGADIVTYSAELPQFSAIEYTSVQQVIYNASDDDVGGVECDISDNVVLTNTLYSSSCTINCYLERTWKYCSFGQCANESATLTYYEYNHSYASCDTATFYNTLEVPSNCTERIICYDPNDFLPAETNDDDDVSLSSNEVIVVIAVVGLVIGVVAVGIFIDRRRPFTERTIASGVKEPLIDVNDDHDNEA